jgi:hypothetical protein
MPGTIGGEEVFYEGIKNFSFVPNYPQGCGTGFKSIFDFLTMEDR